MINAMGLKMITIVSNTWSFALLKKMLVIAIIATPFLLGGFYGFVISNIALWASLFVMFVLGQYFIFKGTIRNRRYLQIT